MYYSSAIFHSPQLHMYPPDSVQKLVEPVAIVGGCYGVSAQRISFLDERLAVRLAEFSLKQFSPSFDPKPFGFDPYTFKF